MEEHLNKLNTESKKCGLKIHKGKTKFITNFEIDEEIIIENKKTRKSGKLQLFGTDNNNK